MMEHYRRPPSRSSGDPARSSSDSRPVKDSPRGGSRERSPAPSRPGQSSSAKVDRSRSRSREPSVSRDARDGAASPKPAAVGARFNDIVREGSDGETFWYVNHRGERASVVYSYSQLEKLTGKSRKELNYPVVCSKRRSAAGRAELCSRPNAPGHETASSSAHVVPFADFADAAEQLFRQPVVSRATPPATHRP